MYKYKSSGFVFLLLALTTQSIQAQSYDLRLDWSDTSNSNGVWSYRQGTSNLPSGTWNNDFASQTAWVGGFPAVWLRTQSTAGFDVQVGDIVTHSANGSSPLTNVIWTSPASGTIDINGGVWMIRDIGRSGNWFLRQNGSLLSSGSLFSGDPFNRANPFNLDAGSGGALNSVAVNAGDIIELSFAQTSTNGDYNGVNFAINLSAVPEPSVLLLTGLAGGAFCVTFYRKMKKRKSFVG